MVDSYQTSYRTGRVTPDFLYWVLNDIVRIGEKSDDASQIRMNSLIHKIPETVSREDLIELYRVIFDDEKDTMREEARDEVEIKLREEFSRKVGDFLSTL